MTKSNKITTIRRALSDALDALVLVVAWLLSNWFPWSAWLAIVTQKSRSQAQTSLSIKSVFGGIVAFHSKLLVFSSMFFLMAKFNSTGDSPSTMSLMLLFGMLMASIDITGLSLSLSLSFCTLYSRLENQNSSRKTLFATAWYVV